MQNRKRTSSYVMTVPTRTSPEIAIIRKAVTIQNLGTPMKHRVNIKARGPRFGDRYTTKHCNATHYDVYIHTRRP